MPSSNTVSAFPSATSSLQTGFTENLAFSTLLELLGWQDKSSEIPQHNDAERDLADTLKSHYAEYLAMPDHSARANLNTSLTTIISKLEKNRATALERAEKANKHKPLPNNFISGVSAKFKTLFGLHYASEMEHYNQQVAKYSLQLQELSQLRKTIQQTTFEASENPEVNWVPNTQRQLLQMPNTSMPVPETLVQHCYPIGVCSLQNLTNPHSGFVLNGEKNGDRSGGSLSSAGDFNGDGRPDYLIGAYSAAKAYVLFGNINGLAMDLTNINLSELINDARGFAIQGNPLDDSTGWSVKGGGDFDGDGFSDVLIGAHTAFNASGAVYLVFGQSNSSAWPVGVMNISNIQNGVRVAIFKGSTKEYCGYSVSMADINGDNITDILVGCPPIGSAAYTGKTYVILGNSSLSSVGTRDLNSLVNGLNAFVLLGRTSSEQSGIFVNSAGDFNNDGYGDFAIAARGAASTFGPLYAGRTALIYGTKNFSNWGANGVVNISTLMNGVSGIALQGADLYELSGVAIASAGDVNRDGKDDLLIATAKDKTYLIYGANNTEISNSWNMSNWIVNLNDLMDGKRGVVFYATTTGGNARTLSQLGNFGGSNGTFTIGFSGDGNGANNNAGTTYVVLGMQNSSAWATGAVNLSTIADGIQGFALQGSAPNNFAGGAIDLVGDIHQDGNVAMIVGANGANGNAGASYVLYGSNASAVKFEHNHIRFAIGDNVVITEENIKLVSHDANFKSDKVEFTPLNMVNGYFARPSTRTVSLSSFSMADIANGVIFIPTGGDFRSSGRLGFWQGTAFVYSDIIMTFLGHAPILGNYQLTVDQGLKKIVTSNELSAVDQDDNPDSLYFSINNLKYGEFRLYEPATDASVPTTFFSLAKVLNNQISFQADGSRNAPSYSVFVTDLKSTTESKNATVTFNFAPELVISASAIIIDQGKETVLRPQDINAKDIETFQQNLIVSVTNVTHGYFAYSASNRIEEDKLNEFELQALTTGSVVFVQNGSPNAPSFSLRVFDGKIYSPWQLVQTVLNYKPVLVNEVGSQEVDQNEPFSFQLPAKFITDPDRNDTLRYEAGLEGGASLPPELSFSPPNKATPGQFSGTLPNIDSYNIAIRARDDRGSEISTTFLLKVIESQRAYLYRTVYTPLSWVGGIGITILAYLWLRRRIAKHRHDFPMADGVRSALNLEYYDFTRFDGDVYKTLMFALQAELQLQYPEFYNTLKPVEQKSFTVCIAETLTKRGLVSRSEGGGGLFGVLCCLNAGWPNQIDMKAFEKEISIIATEAFDSWQKVVNDHSIERALATWPDKSPTLKQHIGILLGCIKSPAKNRFGSGIELGALRKHTPVEENADSGQERKTSAAPSHYRGNGASAFFSAVGKMNQEMAIMTKKLEALEARSLLQPEPVDEEGTTLAM